MPFGYNIYFSDRFNNRVFSYSPDTGKHEILIGDAENIDNSPLREPYGVTFSQSGHLLVSDMLNDRVCKFVDGKLQIIQTKDPNGDRQNQKFKQNINFPLTPAGIFCEENGSLLVSYSDDGTIYRVHKNGELELVLGIPPSRPYTIRNYEFSVAPEDVKNTPIHIPAGIVGKKDGTIFFIERGWQTVRKYHPKIGLETIFSPNLRQQFERIQDPPTETTMDKYYPPYPMGLALDGNTLFLADSHHRCVYETDLATQKMTIVMKSSHKNIKGPGALALGKDKTLWVIDVGNKILYGYKKTKEKIWKKVKEFAISEKSPVCDRVGGMGIAIN